METIQLEKKMRIIWEMFDYIKNTNTSTIAVPRKEKTDKNIVKHIW